MTNGYMTLGETLAHDFRCICSALWKLLEWILEGAFWVGERVVLVVSLVAISLFFALCFIVSAISAYLEIDLERKCTQWYYGTGEFAKK